MQFKQLASGLGLVVLTVVVTTAMITPQEETPQDEKPAAQMSEEEMMKKWAEANALNEYHEAFGRAAGEWVAYSTKYEYDGSKTESVDSASNALIMDGRFLKLEYSGDWDGMPFNGLGFTGYDTVRKEHFTIWFDNFSTGPMVARGKAGDDDDVVTVIADQVNPVDGSKYKQELVTRIVSADEHHLDMYMHTPAGKMHQMHIKYVRKK